VSTGSTWLALQIAMALIQLAQLIVDIKKPRR
jgi:hypothetical protein